jgi:hypothetical protein
VTRDEAVSAIQALYEAYQPGATTKGLSPRNVGGVSLGGDSLYFEYAPEAGTLAVMALVYRFRAKPRPAVLEAFREVEKTEDKGGGKLDFQAPSKSVLLARTYSSTPSPAALKKDVDRLMLAARRWRDDVVPKVAERANARSRTARDLQ